MSDELGDLADQLRDFYLRSHRVVDRMMRAEGVSLARCKLLTFIERGSVVRSADIAAEFGFSPRTVTEAIDALERDGLINRTADPEDRRAKRLSITEAGRAALTASQPARRRFLDDLFGSLPREQRAALAMAIARLNERLRELDGSPGPRD